MISGGSRTSPDGKWRLIRGGVKVSAVLVDVLRSEWIGMCLTVLMVMSMVCYD